MIWVLCVVLVGFFCGAGASEEMPSGDTIEVASLGAVVDDGKDDTPAFLEAIRLAKARPGSRIVLQRGRYDLHSRQASDSYPAYYKLVMEGLKDVTIDGQGAELLVHSFDRLFHIVNCSNLTLTNFKVDYASLPFSQGTVTHVEGNHFDVLVEPEFPVTDGVPVGAFMDFEPDTRIPVRVGLDEYGTVTGTELLGPQLLRVTLRHPARIQAGKLVVLRHIVYHHNAIAAEQTNGLTLTNIDVYTAAGMGLLTEHCRDILLDGFNVRMRPGTGRLMSATADATHFHGTRGTLTIRNGTFEGMGDDAGNIKAGHYLEVRQIVDGHTVEASHNLKLPDLPLKGDKMEVKHKDDMVRYATLTVKEASWLDRDGLHRITFEEPLPEGFRVTDMLGNASSVAKTRISNCVVRNNRARGFLIQGRDVIVEDCSFFNVTSGGVWVTTEVFFFCEAINSENVTIRNNFFFNCNYGGPIDRCVVGAWAVMSENQLAPRPGVHRNITIENNTIIQSDHAGILLAGVDGAVVRGNRLERTSDRQRWDTGNAGIYIGSSRNVVVEGNSIDKDKQGQDFKEAIYLADDNEKDTILVKP